MIIGSDLGSTAMKYHPPGQPFILENDMKVECHSRIHKGELHTVESRVRHFPDNNEYIALSCNCHVRLTGLAGYTKAEQDAIRQEFPNTVRAMPGGLFEVLLFYCGNNPRDVWRFIGVPA